MIEPVVPYEVTSYLARDAQNRYIHWDEEMEAWVYPVESYSTAREFPVDERKLKSCTQKLPLVVPGLKVVCTELKKSRGYVWFTWDKRDCKARYRELFRQFGVADERLAFRECSGLVEDPGGQQRLPGVVEVEPQEVWSPGFFAAWTRYGLQQMDGSFCQRILYPNCGGLEALPHSNWRCTVGNEWWLVGSRGDSFEVLCLEIQGSPLDDRTKENLLSNLETYRA